MQEHRGPRQVSTGQVSRQVLELLAIKHRTICPIFQKDNAHNNEQVIFDIMFNVVQKMRYINRCMTWKSVFLTDAANHVGLWTCLILWYTKSACIVGKLKG